MFCYAALGATAPKQQLFGKGSKYLPGFGGAPSTPPAPPAPTPPPIDKKSSSAGTWLALGAVGVGVFLATR